MGLKDALKEKSFDTRLVDWNIANGVVSKQEYEQHLQNLKDISVNAEALEISDEDTPDDFSRQEALNGYRQ